MLLMQASTIPCLVANISLNYIIASTMIIEFIEQLCQQNGSDANDLSKCVLSSAR